jgi:hypothetical protein
MGRDKRQPARYDIAISDRLQAGALVAAGSDANDGLVLVANPSVFAPPRALVGGNSRLSLRSRHRK